MAMIIKPQLFFFTPLLSGEELYSHNFFTISSRLIDIYSLYFVKLIGIDKIALNNRASFFMVGLGILDLKRHPISLCWIVTNKKQKNLWRAK
jgi:hypothetical protein